jgi:glycine/D-amino acid oxidase-like deaminating enzyme
MTAIPNRSPWLQQLARTRAPVLLKGDMTADVAIIGAGIAGISTAFFLLRDTEKSVLLIDADRVAHGATGHNAGQLVAEFERSFASIAREFGLPMAAAGLQDLRSSWALLEEMRQSAGLKTPVWHVTGYGALSDADQILEALEEAMLREQAGITIPQIAVAEELRPTGKIPLTYEHLMRWTPQADLLALLGTADTRYIGVITDGRGCTNSAMLCEELVQAMLQHYSDRFTLAEMTPVEEVVLHKDSATLRTQNHTVTASQVVLCTNGFERLRISNEDGPDINSRLHHDVKGVVAYMAGRLDRMDEPPAANYYLTEPGTDPEEPYFYVTRRPFESGETGARNLFTIGGPEEDLPERLQYDPQRSFSPKAKDDIEAFEATTFNHKAHTTDSRPFYWHGLMGYTRGMMRLIGHEPCNRVLLYNLGCNGVGILPGIFGAYKVAQLVLGKSFEPSVFDPHDQTCS